MARIILEEVEVADPIRVVLEHTSLPEAVPYGQSAFTTGLTKNVRFKRLRGSDDTIANIGTEELEPLELRGAFRDPKMGAGYAERMKDLLERMAHRSNRILVTIERDTWEGLLIKALFGYEADTGHMTYDCVVGVTRNPSRRQPVPPAANANHGSDEAARLRGLLAQCRQPPSTVRPSLLQQITDARNAVESSLERYREVARLLEDTTSDVAQNARRVIGVARDLMTASEAVVSLYDTIRDEAVLMVSSARDLALWSEHRGQVTRASEDISFAAYSAMVDANQQIRAGARLYIIQTGDTLESIALRFLGDARRTADLGLDTVDLEVGNVVFIPITGGAG